MNNDEHEYEDENENDDKRPPCQTRRLRGRSARFRT